MEPPDPEIIVETDLQSLEQIVDSLICQLKQTEIVLTERNRCAIAIIRGAMQARRVMHYFESCSKAEKS